MRLTPMFASSRIRLFHSSVVSPWPPGRVEHREHGLLIFCQLRLAWPGCVYELGGNYNWRGGVGAYGDAFEIEGDALAVLVSVSQIGNVELILIWYVAGPKLVVFCVTVPVVMALPAIGQAETMAAYSKMPCWFPIAWPSLPVSANGSRRCAAQAEFRPRNRSRRESPQECQRCACLRPHWQAVRANVRPRRLVPAASGMQVIRDDDGGAALIASANAAPARRHHPADACC